MSISVPSKSHYVRVGVGEMIKAIGRCLFGSLNLRVSVSMPLSREELFPRFLNMPSLSKDSGATLVPRNFPPPFKS